MANEPILASVHIAGVKPNPDVNGNPIPCRIVVDDSFSPPRLLVELPDRALRDLGKVDIAGFDVALPAGTNLLGQISASSETSTIYNGTTALTPKFAVIDHATNGDNTVVAAVVSKKIRVLSGLLISAGTVTARFESGAGGTALTGQMSLVANVGFQIPYSPVGNFETAAGSLLNLELSAAVSVDGWLVYLEV